MECKTCKHSIRPGLEISVTGRELEEAFRHCPYCLEIIPSASEPSQGESGNVSVKRHGMRRETRGKFVDRLLAASSDGQLHCPVCAHKLNKSDELILRNGEYFKCHECCHDLATYAYRKEVYHGQRWLPTVFALGDLKAEEKCAGCCYLGAIAKACQTAFSCMPETESTPAHQVANMLRQSDWKEPDCDWNSCFAVKQYQKLAGEILLLL